MNKTSIYYFSLAAIAIGSLASCQDYENGFNAEQIRETVAEREFMNNFIARYGEIDPNHKWGFEQMSAFGSAETRGLVNITGGAGQSNVNTERNNWVSWGMNVPGWPNFDGKYYDSQNQTSYTTFSTDPGTDNIHPCGDVTDYEVDYVSRWFRTYKIGDEEFDKRRVSLNLSDFYIQNVSSDNDRVEYPEGNLITSILNQNNADFGMDHLMFKSIEANAYGNMWTHANDFNSGNSNHNPTIKLTPGENNTYTQSPKDKSENTNRVIKYVKSAGTVDFAYHSSFSTDGLYFNKWVLIRLEWVEEGIKREGYYLAFDYEASKSSGTVQYGPDGYYSNWIIKITPATYKETVEKTKVCRVMCEDLGNTFDFDFNDVVFDVSFEEINNNGTTYDAIITLRAAGGTLPIYVGKAPTNSDGFYEAHRMLGFDSSTPVNVGGEKSNTIANYRVSGLSEAKAELLDIYVVNNGETVTLTSTFGHNLGGNYNDNNNNSHQSPNPGIGSNKVPQRFCVPTTVRWMKECKFIEEGYPSFSSWVTNDTQYSTWYNNIGDPNKIY